MFRGDRIEELPHCTDVVHKEGSLVCLNAKGKPVASFADADVLYYTMNTECIQTIHRLNLGLNEESDAVLQPKPLSASVLERLWRMRKTREVNSRKHAPGRRRH